MEGFDGHEDFWEVKEIFRISKKFFEIDLQIFRISKKFFENDLWIFSWKDSMVTKIFVGEVIWKISKNFLEIDLQIFPWKDSNFMGPDDFYGWESLIGNFSNTL